MNQDSSNDIPAICNGSIGGCIIAAEICFFYCIGFPLVIYSLMILKKDWNQTYVVKRRRYLTLLLIIFGGYLHLIYFPFLISGYIISIPQSLYIIFDFLFILINYIMFGIAIAKFWLYYYDTEMMKFNKNKDWRMAIDPINEGTGIGGTNWFVKNRQKWGKQSFLIKIVFLISIIETCFVFLSYYFVDHFASNIMELIGFIIQFCIAIFSFLIRLYRRNNSTQQSSYFEDSLGIKQELHAFMIVMPFMTLIGYILIILHSLLDKSLNNNDNIILLCWSLWLLPYAISYSYLVGIYPKKLFSALSMPPSSAPAHTLKDKKRKAFETGKSENSTNKRKRLGIGSRLHESINLRLAMWSSALRFGDNDSNNDTPTPHIAMVASVSRNNSKTKTHTHTATATATATATHTITITNTHTVTGTATATHTNSATPVPLDHNVRIVSTSSRATTPIPMIHGNMFRSVTPVPGMTPSVNMNNASNGSNDSNSVSVTPQPPEYPPMVHSSGNVFSNHTNHHFGGITSNSSIFGSNNNVGGGSGGSSELVNHHSNGNVNNISIRGWKDIVCIYDGYEAFMNHLEKEFSVETLLFIHEYVQIKQILKHFFDGTMSNLASKSKYGRYELILPPSRCQESCEMNGMNKTQRGLATMNIVDDKEYIPQSMIAETLFNELNTSAVYEHKDACLRSCNAIIVAFHSIYCKYIDASNAPFMVNISGPQRSLLQKLFDCGYYQITKARRRINRKNNSKKNTIATNNNSNGNSSDNNNNNSNNRLSIKIISKKSNSNNENSHSSRVRETAQSVSQNIQKLKDQLMNANASMNGSMNVSMNDSCAEASVSKPNGIGMSVNNVNGGKSMKESPSITATMSVSQSTSQVGQIGQIGRMIVPWTSISMINKDFERYYAQLSLIESRAVLNDINIDITEQLYEWLLEKVILSIEPSVYEISSLMNDSFRRFRASNKILYQDLTKQLIQFHNQQRKHNK